MYDSRFIYHMACLVIVAFLLGIMAWKGGKG